MIGEPRLGIHAAADYRDLRCEVGLVAKEPAAGVEFNDSDLLRRYVWATASANASGARGRAIL